MRLTSRLVILLSLAFYLAGCWIPERFEAKIVFGADGSYTYSYDGILTFGLALAAAQKGELTAKHEADFRAEATKLAREPGFKRVDYLGKGRYRVQVLGARKPGEDLHFLSNQFRIFSVTQQKGGRVLVSAVRPDQKTVAELRSIGAVVDGVLTVSVANNLIVARHNAEKQPMLGLFGSYSWQIKSPEANPFLELEVPGQVSSNTELTYKQGANEAQRPAAPPQQPALPNLSPQLASILLLSQLELRDRRGVQLGEWSVLPAVAGSSGTSLEKRLIPDSLYRSILAWQTVGIVTVVILEDLGMQVSAAGYSKRIRIEPTSRGLELRDSSDYPSAKDYLRITNTGPVRISQDPIVEVIPDATDELRKVTQNYTKAWAPIFVEHSRHDPLQTAPLQSARKAIALFKRDRATGNWVLVFVDTANADQVVPSRIESYLKGPR